MSDIFTNVVPAGNQSFRRRAFCKIEVAEGGAMRDVTNVFDPHLISVQIINKLEGAHSCNIELDDRYASLSIPPNYVPLIVSLGWAGSGPLLPIFRHLESLYDVLPPQDLLTQLAKGPAQLGWQASGMQVVFMGWIESVESGFARRGGGRRLWLEGKSVAYLSKAKEPQKRHWGDGSTNIPITVPFGEAAATAGLKGKVHGALAGTMRKRWDMNESFLHYGTRLGREFGAAFMVEGNVATLTPLNIERGIVAATWGVNLISWRIKPFVARSQFASAKMRWFNIVEGAWKDVSKAIGGAIPFGNAQATAGAPNAAPNAQVGQQHTGGMSSASELNRGTGWAIINGEPAALARVRLVISGARPGVDGSYMIEAAEHNYTRGGGYTTRCNLVRPMPNGSGYGVEWSNRVPLPANPFPDVNP